MTRHERLREAYEEALFALLMEDVSVEEGARLIEENRRLQEDPSAAVPEEVDRRCLKAIKKSFSKDRRRQAGRVTCRVLGNVSMAIVLCMLLFVTAFAASPKLRVTTLNLLIEFSAKSAELKLESNDAHHSDGETSGYVFEGYILPETVGDFGIVKHSLSQFALHTEYQNSSGKIIMVSVIKADEDMRYTVGTDGAGHLEEISVFGFDGLLAVENENPHFVWGDTQRGVIVDVSARGVNAEAVMEFIEQLGLPGSTEIGE